MSETDEPGGALGGALGGAPVRRILRFGQQVRGETIASIPRRVGIGPGGPAGRLDAALLLPVAHQAWLRLVSRGRLPWQRRVRVIPLSAAQPAHPPEDVLTLRSGLRARCHDGYVGRIEGLSVDATSGRVLDVLLRVRTDVLAEVETPASPFNALLRVAGQVVLIPPDWINAVAKEKDTEKDAGPLGVDETLVHLDASPEQIASGMLIRSDGELSADIWRLWEENPALAPYLERISPVVHDGDVTLRGDVPSPRHKATAEQDVWHVPGVFSVVNELRVTG